MARQLIEKYIFSPGVANAGTIKFPGKCDLTQLLIIANKTNQVNMYAIGDTTRNGTITYDPLDNTTFYSEQQGVSTVTFSSDTSGFLSTDKISIYTDAPKNIGNIVRPYAFGVDAIERQRTANPQSLIDADFEYGLQPTKWQNYSDIRNIPGIFERPGLDLFVTNITTDGNAPSLITVTCSAPHGLTVATPVILYGLTGTNQSSRAEGAFVVNSIPTANIFTYYSKGITGTSGQSLFNPSTYARKGGFYTGSNLPVSSFSSSGASPSVITVTCSANHGLVPGSPLVAVATSQGTNHSLLTGDFYAETVPSDTTFTFTARVGGGVTTTRSALSGVAISGTAGQFTCTGTTLYVGDTITISGTRGGTGTITGYTDPTTYTVSAITGTTPSVTGFTLTTTAGVAIVTTAGTPTGLTYTPATPIFASVFTRSDSFALHRPFDGGVQIGNFNTSHGASMSRQTKKYMRYQSGKGLLWTSGVLFNPVLNLDQISANGTSIGSTITVTTEIDHCVQAGATVSISGVLTSGYNGTYGVASVTSETTFTVIASQVLGEASAIITAFPRVTCTNWSGATVRCGAFDDQNGVFWEYDGKELAVVKRSSTYQISGTVTLTPTSQAITGVNCRFTQQLKIGDNIVIRGMTYKVGSITNDNTLTINPEYRGLNTSSGVKIALTYDQRVPQSQFNYDKFDGSGFSGFNVNLNKMQMMGISFSWYGAGFIDFMMRGADGNMVVAHRMKQNNLNDEAYMRTGNSAVRYQVKNESAVSTLNADISNSDTTVPLVDASRFPTTGGTILIEGELINFTGVSGNNLTGCTRGSSLTMFTGGATRSFTGKSAASHTAGVSKQNAAWLVSCTTSPTIAHWGSSYIMDGGFDNDRGYYFNYAQTGITLTSGQSKTAFFLRLAPSVSNSISGTLGDRDLINRSLLLLQRLQTQSDQSIQVTGILNPSNISSYTDLTWTSVNTVALGSQPSFSQISTSITTVPTPGEQVFSTLGPPGGLNEIDLEKLKELSNSAIGGYNNYPDGPDVLAIVVKNLTVNNCNVSVNLFWSEAQA